MLLPKVFLSAYLVKPTNRSQYPLYHGTLFGMDCHVTSWPPRASLRELESSSCCNLSAASRYVEALSDIIILGADLLLMNCWNASMKLSTVMSGTTSRCTTLVAPYVKRQMYTFFSPFSSWMYIVLVKLTPQTENGVGSSVQTFGSSGGSRDLSWYIGFSSQSYTCDTSSK